MKIHHFTFNPFQTNCYVCASGGEAVIVDPSASTDSEHDALISYIDDNRLVVKHVLLTHAHIDHIFGLKRLCDHLGISYSMHRADVPLMEGAPEQAKMFGVDLEVPGEPGGYIDEHAGIAFGQASWSILHTPGHSPGSVSFVDHVDSFVIGGDVLFAGSIGRTDLWQGSMPLLMRSIFQKVVPLGESFAVYPGHGPATTIGRELHSNPFLSGSIEAR